MLFVVSGSFGAVRCFYVLSLLVVPCSLLVVCCLVTSACCLNLFVMSFVILCSLCVARC